MEAGVCMEIKFPGYGGTKQLGYKSEISGSYSQLSKQMKKNKLKKKIKKKKKKKKKKKNCFSC